MIYTFETMGTVISVDAAERMPEVEAVFAAYDQRFSLFDPASELSAMAAGRIRLLDASAELKAAYELALHWSARTGGAFTPHRPDGVLDLNGIVKALSMDAAGRVLDGSNTRWRLNCGGDVLSSEVLSSGELSPGAGQTVAGIADPFARGQLLTALRVPPRRRAVATSGTSERGEHVWHAGADDSLAQVTVLADDIVTADVLATAILAGGMSTCDEITAAVDCDVLVIDRRGEVAATGGIRFAA